MVGILAAGGYNFATQIPSKPPHMEGQVKVDLMNQGIDVRIENFKLIHEEDGRKEWELNAGLAQVNEKEKVTRLEHVEIKLTQGNKKDIYLYADKGTLQADTQQIDLEGNVKLSGNPRDFMEYFKKKKNEPQVSPKG